MPSVLIIAKPYDAEVMRSALVSAGFSASVWDMISDPVERLQDERPDAVILVCSRCAAQYREDEAARLAEENPPAAEEEIG